MRGMWSLHGVGEFPCVTVSCSQTSTRIRKLGGSLRERRDKCNININIKGQSGVRRLIVGTYGYHINNLG